MANIKEKAVKSLYGMCKENHLLPIELCGNIIQTISKCYQSDPSTISKEELFLIHELESFVKGLKKENLNYGI